MKAIRTKLGDGGRVIIPATFRQNLHLTTGDDIVLHMQEDVIYITTPNQALRKLQAKVRNYTDATGQDISLADELISMRRSEVDSEK
jgi:bifunctional DNA-binding transcriptional regulator/antitoxin component of YhaV-PrlF toxin-antitoxin module